MKCRVDITLFDTTFEFRKSDEWTKYIGIQTLRIGDDDRQKMMKIRFQGLTKRTWLPDHIGRTTISKSP